MNNDAVDRVIVIRIGRYEAPVEDLPADIIWSLMLDLVFELILRILPKGNR